MTLALRIGIHISLFRHRFLEMKDFSMDLSVIAYYIAIADTLSFSTAAEELFLSQSSLSKRIKKFEQALGVELFQRNPHGISLTSAGKSLLPFARRIAMELHAIQEHFGQVPDPDALRLRIAAFSLLSSYGVDKFISSFILKHEEIGTSVREMSSAHCLDALADGSVDCCFSYDYGQFSTEDYTSIPLCVDRLTALCGPGGPLTGMQTISLAQLKMYAVCVPSTVNEPLFLQLLEKDMGNNRFPVQELGIWLSSLSAFLQRSPDSICVLPAQVAAHYGISGIPISDVSPFFLSLVFPSDSILPAFPILLRELEPFFHNFWDLQN